MFELDLFQLLNEFKNTQDENQSEEIKNKIANLLYQNQKEFEELKQKNSLDIETIQDLEYLLEEYKNNTKQNQQEENNNNNNNENNKTVDIDSNYQIIRNYFSRWLDSYLANNREPDNNSINVIDEMINLYAPSNNKVLFDLMNIKDSQDYETFKIMLKNRLRKFYVKKIKEFRNSEEFSKLNLFQRIKKNKQIRNIYKELEKYEFNPDKIEEVLK